MLKSNTAVLTPDASTYLTSHNSLQTGQVIEVGEGTGREGGGATEQPFNYFFWGG